MRVRYRAQALADIDEIRRYLQKRSPSGARNVLRSIYAAVKFIADNPRGSEETDDPDVHVKVILEYPYKIFYSIHAEGVEILHVRHSARRPWEGEQS
ncbi:MAG: type II toxin-antitoxin system RelE/ParE family toxin [Methylocystis sp.]|nr:type II toxin-antitoxin system RelE/ParE family toxin [Methylocystis sp.]